MHMKTTRRLSIGCAVAGILLLALGWWMRAGWNGYQDVEQTLTVNAQKAHEAEMLRSNGAREAITHAERVMTPAAWMRAEMAIGALTDPKEKDMLSRSVLLRRLESYEHARDQLISEAMELAQYDDTDQRILELLDRAKPFQVKIMELLDDPERLHREPPLSLSRDEERVWHAALWYHIGHSNYTELWFVPSENKTEINKRIQKALSAYQQIFAHLPKDTRTEYAIEALYEVNKKKNSDGNQSKNVLKRPILLPQRQQNPTSGESVPNPGI